MQRQCLAHRNKRIFYFTTCGFGGSHYSHQVTAFFNPCNQMKRHYIYQGKIPVSVRK
ncbi:MAG: hypothetical protein KH149_05890 [Clostridiales bacterium]|nr:hypothetical protein [Clostridiales bacterium]